MRATWMLLPIAVLGLSGFANAETWSGVSTLLADKSPGLCAGYQTSTYKLELAENTLTGSAAAVKLYCSKVAVDGIIKHEKKSATGARLEISGNAKTRDLELVNLNSGCRWRLVPKN